MPLSQIIDYFNDQMRGAPVRFLPEDPIRSRNRAVEGYFGPLRLTSVFQPLVAIASGGRLAVGHQAYLRAFDANLAALPAPEVFASTREAAAIVYLDRLCRTVHMLNFLRQATEDGCLFLHVHARHILGVPHEHGEYFEGLLHRCGLIPERIVIQVDPPGTGDADERRRTQAALRNYRRRGYCLTMNIPCGGPQGEYSRTCLGTATGLRATRPHLPGDRGRRVGAGYHLDRSSPRIRSQGHCPSP